MLRYGCTRLEIGVQSVYEDVARDTNRGHTVKAVCESFQLAKDAGYKVVSHMMPDLPNVGLERDMEQFIVCPIFVILSYICVNFKTTKTTKTKRNYFQILLSDPMV